MTILWAGTGEDPALPLYLRQSVSVSWWQGLSSQQGRGKGPGLEGLVELLGDKEEVFTPS